MREQKNVKKEVEKFEQQFSPDKPDEITRELFIERMELSEMYVNSDGSITWYYLAGDMFWGHAIEIDMEEDGTYSDAYIAG